MECNDSSKALEKIYLFKDKLKRYLMDRYDAYTKTTVIRAHFFTPFAQKWSAGSKYIRIIAMRALIRDLLIELSASDLCSPGEK